MNHEKTLTPLSSNSTIFFSRGQENIFIVKKLVKSQESHWSTIINLLNNLLMTNGPVEKTSKPSTSRLKFFLIQE